MKIFPLSHFHFHQVEDLSAVERQLSLVQKPSQQGRSGCPSVASAMGSALPARLNELGNGEAERDVGTIQKDGVGLEC